MPNNKKLKNILGVSEPVQKLTQPAKKEKVFTTFKSQVPPKEDYNIMSDVLKLPKDKGYIGLLTMKDIYTRDIDFEPIKSTSSKAIHNAMKKIFQRDYIKEPKFTFVTDGGPEFKGVVKNWLKDNNIYHKINKKDRHSQGSMIENLNKQLGDIIWSVLNTQYDKNKQYEGWVNIIPKIRDYMNSDGRRRNPVSDFKKYKFPDFYPTLPNFKIGDKVHVKLEKPRTYEKSEEVFDNKNRMGLLRYEKKPRKIVDIFSYPGNIYNRYKVEGIDNATYTEKQLMTIQDYKDLYLGDSSDDEEEEINDNVQFKKIIDHKVDNDEQKYSFKVKLKENGRMKTKWLDGADINRDHNSIVQKYLDGMDDEQEKTELEFAIEAYLPYD